MARRDRGSDLIEIVPLDDVSDWTQGDDEFPARPEPPAAKGRNLLLGAAATAGLVAAAVWLLTVDADRDATPASTTTSVPAPTTTLPPPVSAVAPTANLVVRDVVGVQPYLAENPAPPDDPAVHELWRSAAGDAWLLIDARMLGPKEPPADALATPMFDVVTVRAGDPQVARSLHQPSRTIVRTVVGDEEGGWGQWVVTATADGLDADSVAEFLRSAIVRRSGPDFSERQLPGFDNITRGTMSADEALTGVVRSRSVYWSVAERELITLTVGDDEARARGSLFEVLLTDTVFGTGRIWGRLAADPAVALVTWDLPDGQIATATARMAPEALAAITARVEPADDDKWESLVYGLRPDYRLGEFAVVTEWPAGGGFALQAGVQRAQRREADEWLWWWTVPGTDASVSAPMPRSVLRTPQYTTVAYDQLTYVLVSSPYDGVAVITPLDGSPRIEAPFVRPYPDAGLWTAAFAMEPAVGFGVSIRSGFDTLTPLGVEPAGDAAVELPDTWVVDEAAIVTEGFEPEPFELWRRGEQQFIARVVVADSESELAATTLDRRIIPGDRWDVVIDGFGLDDATLDQLEASASQISGNVVYRTSPFELGFEFVMRGDHEAAALLGDPLLQIRWQEPELEGFVLLTVGEERLETAAIQPFEIVGLTRGQLPDLTGSWVGGTLRRSPSAAIVQWADGGLQYTLIGDVGLPVLLDLLPRPTP